MPKVDVVIVTYNRLPKLKHTLDCFASQTVKCRNIIVVNNNSSDGTGEYLKEWKLDESDYGKVVITMDHNTGGSGGFYEGEKYALSLNPDWIYIADDDAYPSEDMLENFYAFEKEHKNEKLAAICSVVLFPDGTINTRHRARFFVENNTYKLNDVDREEYDKRYFDFNCLSYVGSFLSAEALRSVGLVNKDFFIYQDDCEHSIRLSSYGKFLCCTNVLVSHDEPQLIDHETIQKGLWKEYYAQRNYIYMLKLHFPDIVNRTIFCILNSLRSRKDSSLSPVNKMLLEGIKDAMKGKLGLHPVYRPGLQIYDSVSLPYPKFQWQCIYWFLRIRRLFITNQ